MYKNHYPSFGAGTIRNACWLLPGMLRPLGITLVEMRDTLAVAYLAFETSFDGFKILPVYRRVRRYLFYLFQWAQNSAIDPPTPNQELNV